MDPVYYVFDTILEGFDAEAGDDEKGLPLILLLSRPKSGEGIVLSVRTIKNFNRKVGPGVLLKSFTMTDTSPRKDS